MAYPGLWSYLKGFFCDNDKPDIGKVGAFIIIVSCMWWVFHVVWHTGAIPDLTGISALIGVGSGLPYAINRVDDVVAAWKGNTPPDAIQGLQQPPNANNGMPGQH
jgi:hypothetical protein